MNTRCGMKKKKYTTRWLSGLLIVALILSSIVLPGSGTSVRADNLDDKTVSVENLEKESANKENLASLTDDKENLKNNITDSNNLDFKATDDENLKTRTVDNENINNNTSDNSNSEFNTADTFPVATLSDDGIQLYANNSVNVNAEYFYEIEMEATSTNEHYIAKGIYVDANGNAHIVLGFQKNNNWKDIVKVKIGDKEVISPNYNVILADNSSDASIVINLPNNEIQTLESNLGLMIIEIGKIENITEIFHFAIDTTTSGEYNTGWDLPGATIKIKFEYSIEKDVVKDGVIVDNPEVKIGDEIIYKVTIKNNSEAPLNEIKVTDRVPDGLVVTKIDGKETTDSNKTGTITIAENVTLAKKGAEGSSITYTITAIVSDNAVPGKITNTAIMENKYIVPDEDSADVTVIRAVSIVKKVAGNMGDTTQAFTFNIKVGEEDFGTFDLAHNGVKYISNIPSNGTLKLSELNSEGYKVKVDVNGVEQTVVDGVCTIELEPYGAKDLNIVVTNTKNVLIDTGILLDSLPYIGILVVVIVGGGIFFINKGKRKNDI
ncbi:MAG: hypothetical protein MR510_04995 [Clostridium sp.]|uniref:hypothetical protein n=1 Tax=Clostridium sp. TaxID=1506 RepID=UPI002A8004DA|nr:hypothetical protein [Clostridium sp.]MCI6691824.1 hypothetical protein [Clostridium sp.]MDY4252439.1 hypothetical protein [Clostridium sp.]